MYIGQLNGFVLKIVVFAFFMFKATIWNLFFHVTLLHDAIRNTRMQTIFSSSCFPSGQSLFQMFQHSIEKK